MSSVISDDDDDSEIPVINDQGKWNEEEYPSDDSDDLADFDFTSKKKKKKK